MLKPLYISICVLAITTADPLRAFPGVFSGRIVGGENTTIESYPYQVSISLHGSQECGGSIIAKQWVLTAAQCVTDTLSALTIRAGSTFFDKGGSVHSIIEVVKHEDFVFNSAGWPSNDIALVRVQETFDFDDTRQPISLFNAGEAATPGAISTVTGWGDTFDSMPEVLQYVDVPIISKAQCDENYKTFGGLPDNQICAGFLEGGKDHCAGDAGGPLAIQGRLAGIISWGEGCAQPGYPGVYTEVAAYRSWIKQKSGV